MGQSNILHLHDMGRSTQPDGYQVPAPNIERLAALEPEGAPR
jgi:hypothetical protein